MLKPTNMLEFKREMGISREERDDLLEQAHQDILKRIAETELPEWLLDDYSHGHPYGETYNDVREQLQEQPVGISYASVLMLAGAAVMIIGSLCYWIAKGCPGL